MGSGYESPGQFASVILKLFGFLHLTFALFGLSLVVPHLLTRNPSTQPIDPSAPYVEEAFVVRSAIAVAFLLVQAIAGIYLLALRRAGIRISNVLLVLMILYFLADPVIFITGDGPIRRSIGVTAGSGNVGITLQLITGYPVIALIVLNLIHRKLRRKPEAASA